MVKGCLALSLSLSRGEKDSVYTRGSSLLTRPKWLLWENTINGNP